MLKWLILLVLLVSTSGCVSKSQILMNSLGQTQRCASYGFGIIGIFTANKIQSDCLDSFKSAGYIELENAGVVGIMVVEDKSTNGSIKIVKVQDKSPASIAGVVSGDILLSVGSQQVTSITEAKLLLFGNSGTSVDITISHAGEKKTVKLIRDSYTKVFGVAN